MTFEPSSLDQIRWSDHNVVAFAGLDMHALTMFRDEVVAPSLDALEHKISALEQSENSAERIFGADSYAALHHRTVEGFLLTTQSMHERGIRSLLLAIAKHRAWDARAQRGIQRSDWSEDKAASVPGHFKKLLDAPIQLFGDYQDLKVLRVLANALRHGDGSSAEELHTLCPSLWSHWLAPGTVLSIAGIEISVPAGAPSHPLFAAITLPRSLLEQMLFSVVAFWEDIEFVRCNSFSQRDASTESHIAALRNKRTHRHSARVWSPG
ncbi:hypothetical protein NJG16_01285 [Stenotrophomonas maltophilia]|uniref:hypothetical protein n=1 Tax=Stenotrophomonas lactitubi TaxID=2045214 RepID=UPI00203E476C|nr:hypothetical protein [Stenotrophomonas lactitubi]MCO7468699.1 hypothetical protein [Stenotrophomonas maltophilia]